MPTMVAEIHVPLLPTPDLPDGAYHTDTSPSSGGHSSPTSHCDTSSHYSAPSCDSRGY